MNDIQKLFNLDWTVIIFGIFIIMSAIISIVTIIGKFSEIIKKPVWWIKKKNEDHELALANAKAIKELSEHHEEDTRQSIHHDEMIRDDLKNLTDIVNSLVTKFDKMEQKNNETKVKELKDTIINYYNKYRVIGEWSRLEKDAFWELFEDYESRGGNGYIHSIVEPVMRELREID